LTKNSKTYGEVRASRGGLCSHMPYKMVGLMHLKHEMKCGQELIDLGGPLIESWYWVSNKSVTVTYLKIIFSPSLPHLPNDMDKVRYCGGQSHYFKWYPKKPGQILAVIGTAETAKSKRRLRWFNLNPVVLYLWILLCGSAFASEIIRQEVENLHKKAGKPVVGRMSNLCCIWAVTGISAGLDKFWGRT